MIIVKISLIKLTSFYRINRIQAKFIKLLVFEGPENANAQLSVACFDGNRQNQAIAAEVKNVDRFDRQIDLYVDQKYKNSTPKPGLIGIK
jgi:hypothetical protein